MLCLSSLYIFFKSTHPIFHLFGCEQHNLQLVMGKTKQQQNWACALLLTTWFSITMYNILFHTIIISSGCGHADQYTLHFTTWDEIWSVAEKWCRQKKWFSNTPSPWFVFLYHHDDSWLVFQRLSNRLESFISLRLFVVEKKKRRRFYYIYFVLDLNRVFFCTAFVGVWGRKMSYIGHIFWVWWYNMNCTCAWWGGKMEHEGERWEGGKRGRGKRDGWLLIVAPLLSWLLSRSLLLVDSSSHEEED